MNVLPAQQRWVRAQDQNYLCKLTVRDRKVYVREREKVRERERNRIKREREKNKLNEIPA